jgi:putative acetyltransferase
LLRFVTKMPTTITQERPDSPAAAQLIAELEDHLSQFYPIESRHGFSVEKLLREGVAFFIIRHDDIPAGCGGIQLVGADYAELKRMYVHPTHRRQGLGQRLLQHLETYARQRDIPRLRLETGIHQQAAIALYQRMGFRRIPPFANYTNDPLSRCYEKPLRDAGSGNSSPA